MQPVLARLASLRHKEIDMGQFKPMVKMETTEPSVILKLKKGGHVAMSSNGKEGHKPMKKMDGGAMGALAGTPALIGRPAVNAPVAAPGRPSMNDRRKAMMMAQMMKKRQPAMPAPMMKNGGKADGDMAQDKAMVKKAMKQHDAQEHKGGKGTKLSLKTGGVAMGAAGYAKGGGVKMGNGGGYKTGGVVLGNAGGFKSGGMAMVEKDGKMVPDFAADGKGKMKKGGMMGGGMMGGYKKGGSTKKAYATGGLVNSGKPVAMPEGHKKPSAPVSINKFSGTFKKGGSVKKLNGGGDPQSDKETKGYQGTYTTQKAENLADREAMNPMNIIRPIVDKVRGMFGSTPGAVTKTKESTTVVPAKRRSGGNVNC